MADCPSLSYPVLLIYLLLLYIYYLLLYISIINIFSLC